MSFPVLLDTCVLYGTYLNDLLMRLAVRRTYRPLWSDDILDELERNLIEHGATTELGARRRVAAMRTHFKDALVTGYRDIEAALQCDPKDRHVLAAAVRANAALLVTFNLKDFPSRATDGFDIDVVHPDDFLLDQMGLDASQVRETLVEQAAAYDNPAMDVSALLERLERSGVPRFVAAVRAVLFLEGDS